MIDLFRVRMADGAAERVGRVLRSGYVGQGAVCEEFEREFGALVGALDPPLLVNSCTSAIDLACHLIGIGPGDEVITTPITCTATNSPPALRGARLVWADVDPLTGNVDPTDVERKRTRDTKAIIAVDWAGRCAVTRALKVAAGGTFVIEDAAHALLAVSERGPIAQWGGDYCCWSFQAIKHLSTGDGGALLPPASQIERARLLRWYGLDRRTRADFRCEQDIREIGYKYQSNDIAAAIGLANLQAAEWSVARSCRNAEWYTRALTGVPGVTLAPFDPSASYWIFSILVDDRPSFMEHLKACGIATSQVHARNDRHRAFRQVGEARGPLPGVEYFDAHQVAIPSGYWVDEVAREQVVSAIWDWAHGRREAA
jgi:dTDP-4-amino-4,6-dideoxygalactose transaminase